MAGAVARLYEASKACALPIADFVHESGIARLQVLKPIPRPSLGATLARRGQRAAMPHAVGTPRRAARGSGEVQD